MNNDLINKLTDEEKVMMLCGSDMFRTAGNQRLGIPSILTSDGPNGVKVYNTETTCFPNACLIASSWDKQLAYEVGESIAKECNFYGVNMLLGPGVNIKRSPLCGRNFEYYSEDPLLAGELAAKYVDGLQDNGVGACIKHFAVNNQEKLRFVSNSVVDDRALFDIYLKVFEIVVKKAKPYAIMAAYNKVNGDSCTENKRLLTEILREDWKFDGIVISDWCAVDNAVSAINAGLNIDMPSNSGITYNKLLSAVRQGDLSEEVINRAVQEIVHVTELLVSRDKPVSSCDENRLNNRRFAAEGIVLLKNENEILPLIYNEKVTICGEFALKPRVSGGGSANIGGKDFLIPFDELRKEIPNVFYANERMLSKDLETDIIVKNSDKIIYFAGLTEEAESEGYDRTNLLLPKSQIDTIKYLSNINKNLIVVLQNGSAVETESWITSVKAVVEMYYAGYAGGGAIVDILCGKVNPSGRLAESFPKQIEDTPSYLGFGGDGVNSIYGEGKFVGYRYYLSKKISVSFPFGYGLSYTNFTYISFNMDKAHLSEEQSIKITVTLKNSGKADGKEVVQLYVSCLNHGQNEPLRELKAFEKVDLKVGELMDVQFVLDKETFTRYDLSKQKVDLISGKYLVQIGKNCEDIIFSQEITVENNKKTAIKVDRNTLAGEILECTEIGRIVLNDFLPYIKKWFSISDEQALKLDNPFVKHLVYNMPLRAFVYFSDGTLDEDSLNKLIAKVEALLKGRN